MGKTNANKDPRYSLKRTQKKVVSRFNTLSKNDEGFIALINGLKKSNKVAFVQVGRRENKQYDESWIKSIESACAAMDVIVKNPSRFIKEVRQVVPIAKAKKINNESLVHLSSHTQFIRSVDEHGNVTPEKILSLFGEDDFAIYENRFIYTLIKKLVLFIEKRYSYIMKYVETKNSDTLVSKATLKYKGFTYDIETKASISYDNFDQIEERKAEHYKERIANIRKRVNYYLSCDFVNKLGSDIKPVKSPIMKTNLLMKNPYYRACYNCWRFIDTYDKLGVKFTVKKSKHQIDDKYLNSLYALTVTNMMALQDNEIPDISFTSPSAKRKVYIPRTRPIGDEYVFDDTKFKGMLEDKIVVYADRHSLDLDSRQAELDDLKAKEEREKLEKEERDRLAKLQELERKRLAEIAEKERLKQKKEEERLAKLEKERKKRAELEAKRLEEKRKRDEILRRKKELDLLAKTRAEVKRQATLAKNKELENMKAETKAPEAIPEPVVSVTPVNENEDAENIEVVEIKESTDGKKE